MHLLTGTDVQSPTNDTRPRVGRGVSGREHGWHESPSGLSWGGPMAVNINKVDGVDGVLNEKKRSEKKR